MRNAERNPLSGHVTQIEEDAIQGSKTAIEPIIKLFLAIARTISTTIITDCQMK